MKHKGWSKWLYALNFIVWYLPLYCFTSFSNSYLGMNSITWEKTYLTEFIFCSLKSAKVSAQFKSKNQRALITCSRLNFKPLVELVNASLILLFNDYRLWWILFLEYFYINLSVLNEYKINTYFSKLRLNTRYVFLL